MKNFIIAIDFDGVIAEVNSNWMPGTPNVPGFLIKDVDVYIRKLHEDGHKIIIWTCRGGHNLYLAEQFIEDHNIPYDRINDNVDGHYEKFKHNTRKVHADIYIDDHQIGDLPSWKEIYEIIKKKAEK